jgi:molybdenum cofactor biosynthesis enzyme MoaA
MLEERDLLCLAFVARGKRKLRLTGGEARCGAAS